MLSSFSNTATFARIKNLVKVAVIAASTLAVSFFFLKQTAANHHLCIRCLLFVKFIPIWSPQQIRQKQSLQDRAVYYYYSKTLNNRNVNIPALMPPLFKRPPPMENWDQDVLADLNMTVDVHALSRDVPRLKIASPQRHSVRNAAAVQRTLQRNGSNETGALQEVEELSTAAATAAAAISSEHSPLVESAVDRADSMCSALLYLEELINGPVPVASSHKGAAASTPDNSPDAEQSLQQQRIDGQQIPAHVSPLREQSEKLYPAIAREADLSSAFMTLLRASGWLPSEEAEAALSAETGHRTGKIPVEKLPSSVRILGALAQTVMFAPSRRMAHVFWTPNSAHLRDVDWEVFLRTEPWPVIDYSSNHQRAAASPDAPKSKAAAGSKNERSPLLGKNADDDDDGNTGSAAVASSAHKVAVRGADAENTASPSLLDNDTIYVCHRVVSRNVIDQADVGRHPRFQILWVLELHCSKSTGVCSRAKITGVRVRLQDDEASMSSSSCGCTCCGASSEWLEQRDKLAKTVQEVFGIELEKKDTGSPF